MMGLFDKILPKGDPALPSVRQKGVLLGGVFGIVCNLVLFAIKLAAGMLSGSLSITADAFNNLSDSGSSVVTMLGVKIASKPADSEHPFGHGRMEYMSASFVSALIIVVALRLFGESVGKFKNPETPEGGALIFAILAVSIAVKLVMAAVMRKMGKRFNSEALLATSSDSLGDCVTTGAVLLVSVVCFIFSDGSVTRYLDPIAGILVSVFILISGLKSLKETLDPLIGMAPDPEMIKKIEKIVLEHHGIIGMHDMIVHNYGPGRSFVSLHAEVPANENFLDCHEDIDHLEREIAEKVGVSAVIHMDPIVTDDETVNSVRAELKSRIAALVPGMTMHDFRMIKGEKQSNLIFDVVVPAGCKLSGDQIRSAIGALARDIDKTYCCVITLDEDYSGGQI